MIAPFEKIVINKKAEANFKRRAIRRLPHEHMEALWGYVRKNTLYVCVFMPMEVNLGENGQPVKPREDMVRYNDIELDHNEDEAQEYHLEFLGTCHTHPGVEDKDSIFSEGDLRDMLETQESVVAICTIWQPDGSKRRRCNIAYWPTIRPLKIVYTDHS